jgi:hypothetical protein
MDAKGGYKHGKDPDKCIQAFIESAQLVDPFYSRFNISPRTYMSGTKRIGIDVGSVSEIHNIGYLRTQEGTDSDHVVGYLYRLGCETVHARAD